VQNFLKIHQNAKPNSMFDLKELKMSIMLDLPKTLNAKRITK